MKTEDVLALNLENEEEARKMQAVLKKFKSLRVFKDERVPLEEIEKAVTKLTDKYQVTLQPMFVNKVNGKTCYSVGVRNDYDKSHMRTLYAGSLYEMWCKLLVFIFSEARRANLRPRDADV